MENGHDRVDWFRLTNSISWQQSWYYPCHSGNTVWRWRQCHIVNDAKLSSNSSADPLCTTPFVMQLLGFKLYHSIDLAVLTAMHIWVTQVELSLRILSFTSNHGVRWSCGQKSPMDTISYLNLNGFSCAMAGASWCVAPPSHRFGILVSPLHISYQRSSLCINMNLGYAFCSD